MTISVGELREIVDVADAVNLLRERHLVTPEWANEINGFGMRPAEYKNELVGVPFLIVEATLRPGDNQTTFVELLIIDTLNRKVTLRDSSRGIHAQILAMLHDRQHADGIEITEPFFGIWVRRGLRFKEYPFTDRATQLTTMTRTYELDM